MVRITAAFVLLAFGAAAVNAADEKPSADKLVGTWKMTKSENLPPGGSATIVYSKDGTAVATIEVMGQKLKLEAKWKIDGDKLVMTTKLGDKEKMDTDTIVTLSDTKPVTKDSKGKTDEFERVKEEKK